jgi:hypothetical protein
VNHCGPLFAQLLAVFFHEDLAAHGGYALRRIQTIRQQGTHLFIIRRELKHTLHALELLRGPVSVVHAGKRFRVFRNQTMDRC